jgi:hypothetical protein
LAFHLPFVLRKLLTNRGKEMTIKLIKRNQQTAKDEKPSLKPQANQILATTQGWVEEFREKKARNNEMLIGMLRRA